MYKHKTTLLNPNYLITSFLDSLKAQKYTRFSFFIPVSFIFLTTSCSSKQAARNKIKSFFWFFFVVVRTFATKFQTRTVTRNGSISSDRIERFRECRNISSFMSVDSWTWCRIGIRKFVFTSNPAGSSFDSIDLKVCAHSVSSNEIFPFHPFSRFHGDVFVFPSTKENLKNFQTEFSFPFSFINFPDMQNDSVL